MAVLLPDVLDTVFVIVVIDSNAEYLVNEVSERLMYGMFAADIIYDLTLIIEHVNVQCHPSNSAKCEKMHFRLLKKKSTQPIQHTVIICSSRRVLSIELSTVDRQRALKFCSCAIKRLFSVSISAKRA